MFGVGAVFGSVNRLCPQSQAGSSGPVQQFQTLGPEQDQD